MVLLYDFIINEHFHDYSFSARRKYSVFFCFSLLIINIIVVMFLFCQIIIVFDVVYFQFQDILIYKSIILFALKIVVVVFVAQAIDFLS